MFWLIKKIFIVLLTDLVNGSNHTKCVSLSNQKCMTRPTLIVRVNLTLLIYILMNMAKNFTNIHLWLN